MDNETQEKGLKLLAEVISDFTDSLYDQKMGFFLCVTPLDGSSEGVADYIANCEREDGIKWLRETADRLERNESIGPIKGQAWSKMIEMKEYKAMVEEWLWTQTATENCKQAFRDSLITMFKEGVHPGEGNYTDYKILFDRLRLRG